MRTEKLTTDMRFSCRKRAKAAVNLQSAASHGTFAKRNVISLPTSNASGAWRE
jgi:hypothetical protein